MALFVDRLFCASFLIWLFGPADSDSDYEAAGLGPLADFDWQKKKKQEEEEALVAVAIIIIMSPAYSLA